ncbi:hypothetical protein [Thalassobius sp. Cn5-15]|uniref:hypothetical protein n=1 Tax=Thalassobius sp. Cn5-15 TaxID=2917763 RepID=UPI001EF35BF4|nr:hypothetical protein [Thalassobius sp. Cn5-15]MCG7492417.1 hypothetical protein [Thalassobius sp. Cn5-15]
MTLKFTIEIECGNAAFDPESGGEANEIDRILSRLCRSSYIYLMAQSMHNGADEAEHSLSDLNGNRVGTARFTIE